MKSATIGVLAFCLVLCGLIAAQPDEASAGPVLRVATWPVRALIPGKRCHGKERKAKDCHGHAEKCGG